MNGTSEPNKTADYVREILTIVFLTNIIAILFLPTRFGQAIGWITGSVGSGLNFFWLSLRIRRSITASGEEAKIHSYKGFLLRYLFLALYSVMAVVLLKPDIMVFGAGLVSVQIIIYLHHFYRMLRPGKEENEKDQTDERETNNL